MKCPHCKRPVHVRTMQLGLGRTEYVMNPSLENKANRRAAMLANLINTLVAEGKTNVWIGKAIGVSDSYVAQYLKKAKP